MMIICQEWNYELLLCGKIKHGNGKNPLLSLYLYEKITYVMGDKQWYHPFCGRPGVLLHQPNAISPKLLEHLGAQKFFHVLWWSTMACQYQYMYIYRHDICINHCLCTTFFNYLCYMFVYIYIYSNMYIYTYIHIYIYTHTYICIYLCIYIYISFLKKNMYMYIYAYVYIYIYVCVYMCQAPPHPPQWSSPPVAIWRPLSLW